MEKEKWTPEIIFNKFIEQLEPKENFRVNCLKLMTYRQEAEDCKTTLSTDAGKWLRDIR